MSADALDPERAAFVAHVAEVEREAAALRSQRDSAWMQLETMRRSFSWRLTWPLRRLARMASQRRRR